MQDRKFVPWRSFLDILSTSLHDSDDGYGTPRGDPLSSYGGGDGGASLVPSFEAPVPGYWGGGRYLQYLLYLQYLHLLSCIYTMTTGGVYWIKLLVHCILFGNCRYLIQYFQMMVTGHPRAALSHHTGTDPNTSQPTPYLKSLINYLDIYLFELFICLY